MLPNPNDERYTGEDMELLNGVFRAVALHAGAFFLYSVSNIEPGLEIRILGSFLMRQLREIEETDSIGQSDITKKIDNFIFDNSPVPAQYRDFAGVHFMFLKDEETGKEEDTSESAERLNVGGPTLTTLAMEILHHRNCDGGELYDIKGVPDPNQIYPDNE
jgi:hypothetical protein